MTTRLLLLLLVTALVVPACHEERDYDGSPSGGGNEDEVGEDQGNGPASGEVVSELHPSCDPVLDWYNDWRRFEDQVLVIVNEHRASGATCGNKVMAATTPLMMEETLRCAARLHSLDMAVQNYFEHTGLDGRSPFDRIADVDYQGSYPLGENIAWGSRSAAQVMEGWMNSPGHCENIMGSDFGEIGIGFAQPELGQGPYWTQKFGGK